MAFVNQSKSSSTFATQSKSSDANQGFDVGRFDFAIFDLAGITYSNQTKNSSSFTNLTKN